MGRDEIFMRLETRASGMESNRKREREMGAGMMEELEENVTMRIKGGMGERGKKTYGFSQTPRQTHVGRRVRRVSSAAAHDTTTRAAATVGHAALNRRQTDAAVTLFSRWRWRSRLRSSAGGSLGRWGRGSRFGPRRSSCSSGRETAARDATAVGGHNAAAAARRHESLSGFSGRDTARWREARADTCSSNAFARACRRSRHRASARGWRWRRWRH